MTPPKSSSRRYSYDEHKCSPLDTDDVQDVFNKCKTCSLCRLVPSRKTHCTAVTLVYDWSSLAPFHLPLACSFEIRPFFRALASTLLDPFLSLLSQANKHLSYSFHQLSSISYLSISFRLSNSQLTNQLSNQPISLTISPKKNQPRSIKQPDL